MNENVKEIEIALRDGLIDELAEATKESALIIKRLATLISRYEAEIVGWESQNMEIIQALTECVEQRDRARATAVRLEQECHSCMDTVHHGNEEVYEGDKPIANGYKQAIERVRMLHVKQSLDGEDYCGTCSFSAIWGEWQAYPCQTIQALDGDD